MKTSRVIFFLIFCTIGLQFDSKAATTDFIQFEANKTLGLFSFLETAIGTPGSSATFMNYIQNTFSSDEHFIELIDRYREINLNYQFRREEYPFSRYSVQTIKDFLWIASANARDIDDLSNRIIGYLPHLVQVEFIAILRALEPMYDAHIWNKQRANTDRILQQLSPFANKISALFKQITTFYGTDWSMDIPFKVQLYPVPMQEGMSTALPKGNILICSFLAEDEQDYLNRLAVIVHEMCHTIFNEQPPGLQHQIDKWFSSSDSEYSKLAYSYINEGLATAIGNGWAHEQIHGEENTAPWYGDSYIDGYARSLCKHLVVDYLEEAKTMDEAFIQKAIELFGQRFPGAIRQTTMLMNEVQIYANAETEAEIGQISNALRSSFRISSSWFSSPIMDDRSKERFAVEKTTKLFVISSQNQPSLNYLKAAYSDLTVDLPATTNFIYSFMDITAKSSVIIINIVSSDDLNAALSTLRTMEYLEYEALIEID